MTPSECAVEMSRLSRLLDGGIDTMRTQAAATAQAEHDYRKAKAIAWTVAEGATAKAKEAWVDAETADERYVRDVAEGMGKAALEAVRARRTQVSALQSLLNATRAELDFAKYSPEMTP